MERRLQRTHLHLRAIVEWALAMVFILVMIVAASIVVREFRTVSGAFPVMAREAPAPVPPIPAGVPSRAVSVPVLLLSGGKDVRVGEPVSQVEAALVGVVDAAEPSYERGPNGERVTRYYDYAGTRFVIVFEPFEKNAEPRVAAIYLP